MRLVLENDRVTGEEHLLADRGQRIRDVRQGPDGALYVVTDEANGELWKIVPRRWHPVRARARRRARKRRSGSCRVSDSAFS